MIKIQLNQYEVDVLRIICGRTTVDVIECFNIGKGLSTIISPLYHDIPISGSIVKLYNAKKPINYYIKIGKDLKIYLDEKYKNHQNKYVIEFTQEELNVLYSICVDISGDPVFSARGVCDVISCFLYDNNLVSKQYSTNGNITFFNWV